MVPPWSEFIELLTLLDGVVCFSFIRPFALCREDCDPATSLVPWALSAFFLLLNRNAIVPFEAGGLLSYADAPQNLQNVFSNVRNRGLVESCRGVCSVGGAEKRGVYGRRSIWKWLGDLSVAASQSLEGVSILGWSDQTSACSRSTLSNATMQGSNLMIQWAAATTTTIRIAAATAGEVDCWKRCRPIFLGAVSRNSFGSSPLTYLWLHALPTRPSRCFIKGP